MICKDIIKGYLSFLNKSFIVEETKLGCHIITPFIGYSGEAIDFYIEQLDEKRFRFTDAGNTLIDLETVNVNVNYGKEQEVFIELLKLYNIYEESGELFLDTISEDLSKNFNLFINALQSFYNMEYLKAPSPLGNEIIVWSVSRFHVYALLIIASIGSVEFGVVVEFYPSNTSEYLRIKRNNIRIATTNPKP